MKKSTLFTLVAIFFATGVFAQQVPMYSHYYFNRFLYNPAITGAESFGQAYLIYRNQWNKLPDAPVTKAFTIDGPLRNKQIGLGLGIFQDQAGLYNSTGGQLAYRYGLKLNKDQNLDLGISLGFLDNRIDFNRMRAKHGEDVVIQNQYSPETGFDATFGAHYKYKKLGIGFSVPQVLGNKIVYDNTVNAVDVNYGLKRHYIGTIRYDFDITDKLSFEPIAMVRAVGGAPVQYDVNAMFNWNDMFYLGGMYRSQYAATVSAAASLFKQLVLGYSYDMAVNTNKQYLRGAHEVMLGYRFGGSSSEDPDIKKRFETVEEKVKKNEDDIKTNKDNIDKNKQGIDKNAKDIDEDVDRLQKEIDDLRGEFGAFKKSFDDGTNGRGVNVGDQFGFKNVYFDTDKYSIRNVDVTELNQLASILNSNPNMKIAVMGHTDYRGSKAHNEKLALRRANAVKDYLVARGISASRLSIESFGFDIPTSDVLSENRRVEFKVLSK